MSYPYAGAVDDGEGSAAHPVPGSPGATQEAGYLSPWYVPGATSHLGALGAFVSSDLIPSTPGNLAYASFPADLATGTTIIQRYFSPDQDPLGGFLTFMPSDSFTITESGITYRVPRRLAGTETWPSLNSGVSPWAFSMEGSGSIYIWRGLLVAKLFPTDSPKIVTDSGQPLTYHVTEHFTEGRQFDISVPTSASAQDLYSLIVPGTDQPCAFDPVSPLGSLLEGDLWTPASPPLPVQSQSHLSTAYVTVVMGAVGAGGDPINISTDSVYLAFLTGGQPVSGDWHAASWVTSGGNPIGPPYQAQVLIGPGTGGVPLAQGTYAIWSQLADAPQVLVAQIGTLYIT